MPACAFYVGLGKPGEVNERHIDWVGVFFRVNKHHAATCLHVFEVLADHPKSRIYFATIRDGRRVIRSREQFPFSQVFDKELRDFRSTTGWAVSSNDIAFVEFGNSFLGNLGIGIANFAFSPVLNMKLRVQSPMYEGTCEALGTVDSIHAGAGMFSHCCSTVAGASGSPMVDHAGRVYGMHMGCIKLSEDAKGAVQSQVNIAMTSSAVAYWSTYLGINSTAAEHYSR
eukprot:6149146-Amphidinium_carterae.1